MFRPTSPDAINSLPKRFTTIPVIGFWDSHPVCLDIYQVNATATWAMPTLADIMQIDACVKPARKDKAYHFLVWQHTRAERYPADLAVYCSPL
jgi:hypothetical protein